MTAVLMLALVAAAPASPGWTLLAPGVEHRRVEAGAVELFRFDLEAFRADVVVPGPAKPQTAAALRKQAGAALVVNGGFFDTEGRSLGLRIADGRKVIGLRPNVDWGVLVLRSGRAAIVHSRDFPDGNPQRVPNPPRDAARRAELAGSARGFAPIYVPATRTRLRPAFLAANSARSAAASTSAGSAPSSGNDATPTEIVSLPLGCVLPNSKGNSATWAQIRSATSLAAARPTSSRMIANSSPP